MKEIKYYDPENRLNELYKAGKIQHYEQNLCSIMCEKIKSNCEIATELAWRDWQIEQLQARIKELELEISKLGAKCEEYSWSINKLENVNHINEIKAQGIEWAVEFASFDCTVYDDPVCVLERVEKYAEQLRAKHD